MLVQTALGRVFGSVVAVVVGSVTIAGVGAGQACAQECDPTEIAKLLAEDGAAYDRFGWTVSIDGETALVGARWDEDNGSNSGSAYVFTRSGDTWTQQAKLLPDDGEPNDLFGYSVFLSGDTAIIGGTGNHGSAYIFTRSGGVWTQQAKLLPSDGVMNSAFGRPVFLGGSPGNEIALVGAHRDNSNGTDSGSVYIFARTGGTWAQEAKLQPGDGAKDDRFGWAASLGGPPGDEFALIGANGDSDNGADSGSVYVFARNGNTWTEQAKLLPDEGAAENFFGSSVSLHGPSGEEVALIGEPGDSDNGFRSGSAYIFTRNGLIWTQQAKLLPADGDEGDFFGVSAALGGPPGNEIALIGAIFDEDNGSNSGSVYVFSRSGDTWTEQTKLLPDDGAEGDQFGIFVSLSGPPGGEVALIGAQYDSDNGSNSGSAYVFDLNCTTCPADLNGDGVVNTQDFLAFLGLWSAGDPLADWNDDGTINTLDFLAYLADWGAGC